MDESGTDGAECSRKVLGAFSSLVKLGIFSLSVLVLDETLLAPVLTYGSETMLWKKERYMIRGDIQMDNFRGLLSIRRMDRVPNAQIGSCAE